MRFGPRPKKDSGRLVVPKPPALSREIAARLASVEPTSEQLGIDASTSTNYEDAVERKNATNLLEDIARDSVDRCDLSVRQLQDLLEVRSNELYQLRVAHARLLTERKRELEARERRRQRVCACARPNYSSDGDGDGDANSADGADGDRCSHCHRSKSSSSSSSSSGSGGGICRRRGRVSWGDREGSNGDENEEDEDEDGEETLNTTIAKLSIALKASLARENALQERAATLESRVSQGERVISEQRNALATVQSSLELLADEVAGFRSVNDKVMADNAYLERRLVETLKAWGNTEQEKVTLVMQMVDQKTRYEKQLESYKATLIRGRRWPTSEAMAVDTATPCGNRRNTRSSSSNNDNAGTTRMNDVNVISVAGSDAFNRNVSPTATRCQGPPPPHPSSSSHHALTLPPSPPTTTSIISTTTLTSTDDRDRCD